MEKHVDNVDFEFLYKWFCDACTKVSKERNLELGLPSMSYHEGMMDAVSAFQVICVAYPEFLRLNAGEHKREEEIKNAKNQTTVEESK